jgi:hypothetical protein
VNQDRREKRAKSAEIGNPASLVNLASGMILRLCATLPSAKIGDLHKLE